MPDELLTTLQAAAVLGVTVGRILQLCREGRLPGAIHSSPQAPRRGQWAIPAASVAAYAAERRQPTRLKTHCKHGHSYSEHGVQYAGRRKCGTCERERQKRVYAERKGKMKE